MKTNGTIMQFFEWYLPSGMLWQKLSEEAAALASNGITAVWIPPAYKGSSGSQDVGYSTYDIWDLGEFDQKGSVATKYGTKEQLVDAIKAAHSQGMEIYADIVLDHMMGADGQEEVTAQRVYADNRLQNEAGGLQKISAWTYFCFPGRGKKYSDFEWHWYHFDGVDWDASANRSGIYLFQGKSWDPQVDQENGNSDYLMGADLDLSSQEVIDELTRWGRWFVQELDVDGFRFDAVKHMKSDFYRKWIADIRATAKEELFSVGEYWNGDVGRLLHYLDETGNTFSLFDVPLHFHLFEAATSNGSYDMRSIFDNTLASQRPQSAVTFVDNHDTQPGQALQSFVPAWFKPHAYALILLRDAGYPCVFYGDYYGMNDFPSQKEFLDNLLRVRAYHAYGPQHDYFDHPDIIGWTREGDSDHENSGTAVLMTNRAGGSKTMYIGKQHAGRQMCPVLRSDGPLVTIGEDGTASFTVGDGAVETWTF